MQPQVMPATRLMEIVQGATTGSATSDAYAAQRLQVDIAVVSNKISNMHAVTKTRGDVGQKQGKTNPAK